MISKMHITRKKKLNIFKCISCLFIVMIFVNYLFQPSVTKVIRGKVKHVANFSRNDDWFYDNYNVKSTTKIPPMNKWESRIYDIFDRPDPRFSGLGPDNTTLNNKYVIYRCDDETMKPCGGWADRVRGVITTYLIANLTGRVFKAEIVPKCDVTQYLLPNRVNWSLPFSFHKKVQPNATVKMLDMWAKWDFYKKFKYTDWVHHPGMNSNFLYIKSNHDNVDNFKDSIFHSKDLLWMKGRDRTMINRFLFTYLFRPTAQLRRKISSFLEENVGPDDKLVCAHLRMGRTPTIPNEFNHHNFKLSSLTNVWNLFRNTMNKNANKTKFFIMSDSDGVIAKAKELFPKWAFHSPGRIVHIELTQNITVKEKCDGFEKVLFEQLVLTLCDDLIIGDSGLSRMSAYLRGLDEGLYCFLPNGIDVVKCSMMDIKWKLYHTNN